MHFPMSQDYPQGEKGLRARLQNVVDRYVLGQMHHSSLQENENLCHLPLTINVQLQLAVCHLIAPPVCTAILPR